MVELDVVFCKNFITKTCNQIIYSKLNWRKQNNCCKNFVRIFMLLDALRLNHKLNKEQSSSCYPDQSKIVLKITIELDFYPKYFHTTIANLHFKP